jgi:hypothetical protein
MAAPLCCTEFLIESNCEDSLSLLVIFPFSKTGKQAINQLAIKENL